MTFLRSRLLRALAALMLCAAPLAAQAQGEGEAPPPGAPAPPPGAPPAPPSGATAPAPSSAPNSASAQGAGRAELDRTPPRLSFTDGEVSFWRNGAEDWSPAQVNTPLGEGDQLYVGDNANLEVQVGAHAFVRAGEQTQLGVTNIEPDFVQFRIVNGHASLDLRALKAGSTFEIDTPNAAFTVEHPGYYRIEVTDQNTSFTSRRGGRATATPSTGQPAAVAASETVVVSGTDQPQLETYAAAELDDWDRWNYTRTDQLLDAVSSRYVPDGVYGVDDLDHNGDWRVVPTYGSVWVPRVAPGWAPYSTGSWVYDPFYGWTWVDTAPWGWAPFHYGRWVSVGGYWAWAPGPLVAHPYYSPALVAFFGVPSFSVGISFGHGGVGWVALGWGEPCLPWWGPAAFRGHPHWNGWGGPHIVNNVVINKTTVVNVNNVHWANAGRTNAVLGVRSDQFGRGRVKPEHFDAARVAKLETIQGNPDVKPQRASLAPTVGRAQRPPSAVFDRSVVATREAARRMPAEIGRTAAPTRERAPVAQKSPGLFDRSPAPTVSREQEGTAARVVSAPKRGSNAGLSNRPPFGTTSSGERTVPPQPPRFREPPASAERTPASPVPGATRDTAPGEMTPHAPPAAHGRTIETSPQGIPQREPRNLPGEPANRVFRGRPDAPRMEAPQRAPQVPQHVSPTPQVHPQGGGQGHPRTPAGVPGRGAGGGGQRDRFNR
ncbi:MAG TPA: DUF6600 domain-containing protein [Myxococcota bacterium]|nr:DUF6600 domain-containing protein [Myxococcota bacterium]